MRRSRDAKEARDREAAQALAAQLGSQTIQVKARAGEGGKLFGSVTAADVADAVLAQTGIELDRRKVVLDEPIRELGDAQVRCVCRPRSSWASSWRSSPEVAPIRTVARRGPPSRPVYSMPLLHEVVGGEPARDRREVGHRELVREHRGRRGRGGHAERGDHAGEADRRHRGPAAGDRHQRRDHRDADVEREQRPEVDRRAERVQAREERSGVEALGDDVAADEQREPARGLDRAPHRAEGAPDRRQHARGGCGARRRSRPSPRR